MKLKFWEKDEPQNATLKEPEWWRQTANNYTLVDAGVDVNQQTAMQLSAFFACIRILAESVGSLPLKIYRRNSDGGKEPAYNHPLNRVFSQVANEEMTPQELIEFVMASALLRGTAYCEKEVAGNGQVIALHPLDSAHMHVTRDSRDRLVFDYQEPKRGRVYSAREIWRVPGLSGDGVTGYSTIAYAKQTLGTAIATERHAAKTFANGARISGIFEMDSFLPDEARDRLQADLAKYTGVNNANKTLLLESGLKYKGVSMNHDEAQFLQSRKFQIAEIARWFRVPLHMLAELDKSSFNNIEHQSIEFVMHTLRPWCERIEQTITRDLIAPRYRGLYFAEFTLDALLRGDTKSRYEAHAIALGNSQTPGWASVNEIRRLENMNPIPGYDDIQKTYSQAGEQDQPDVEQQMAALNKKEVTAIRVEYERLPEDEFEQWLPDFYQRVADSLIKDGVDEETASQWAETRMKKVINSADVPALMDEWEQV